jgi:hypothetical protein
VNKLEIGLIGLTTCVVPFSLTAIADGIENGTRPLNKDEIVEQLRAAAETVKVLNETLLETVKQVP